MAFGVPVVPEVKAISAVSSAAVSQFSNPPDLSVMALSSDASTVARCGEIERFGEFRFTAAGLFHRFGQRYIAERVTNLGLLDDIDQFTGA